MFYITKKATPRTHQVTFDDLFNDDFDEAHLVSFNPTATVTKKITSQNTIEAARHAANVPHLYTVLRNFNKKYEKLRSEDRHSLYNTFYIPKKSGGMRKIDAPNDDLKSALSELSKLFQNEFHALYHTAAFAYVKGRCTVDAVKKHQSNGSKWFGKYDLHGFFPSTTIDFVMKQFSMIYPFNFMFEDSIWKDELQTALSLGFLDGGLPQGTPLSPLITNIMMIPVDHELSNMLHNYENQTYVFTRYADDFLVSSRYDFDSRKIEKVIKSVLESFGAPFYLNAAKTRYGSSAGRNWNLGVMLNKDNEITVGHKNKKHFQDALYHFLVDDIRGEKKWALSDMQILHGQYSYYRMVEGKTIDEIIKHFDEKYKCETSIIASLRERMKERMSQA